MERVAVFVALPWEGRTVRKSVRGVQRVRCGPALAWCGHAPGREIWLVRTGIGEERAAVAAHAAARSARFQLFLSTGCAAGLVRELHPGDIVIADEIVARDGRQRFCTDADTRRRIEDAASRAALEISTGAVACAGAVLADREAKRAEAAASGAIAAEMEGAAIARVALGAGARFAALRAILDPFDVELEYAARLVDPRTGRVRPFEVVRSLASGTKAWSELMGMQRRMAAARASLERIFASLLREAPIQGCDESSRWSEAELVGKRG